MATKNILVQSRKHAALQRKIDRLTRAIQRIDATRDALSTAAIFGSEKEYQKAYKAHQRALAARCKAANALYR